MPVVVDHSARRARPFDADEHRRRGDAAGTLWREMVRRVTAAKRER
jgi:hypothetical protein